MLYSYCNGNYNVNIYEDGTKERITNDNSFEALFPENIDIKITDYCDVNCPMCHEKSTVNGLKGNLNHIALNTLKSGTEIAIGGGNPVSHPELESFLFRMKNQKIISNITINQFHFMKPDVFDKLKYYVDSKLVYGIGVSLTSPSDDFIRKIKKFSNIVIHIINGYHRYESIEKLFGNNLKVLILGYKLFGRGVDYFSDSVIRIQKDYYKNIHKIIKGFKITSFDNLAIEQLKIQRTMLDNQWDEFYMGDDGSFTFYIDLVKEQFSKNSFANNRFPLTDDVTDMFQYIKKYE